MIADAGLGSQSVGRMTSRQVAVFTRTIRAQSDTIRAVLGTLRQRLRSHVDDDLLARAELVLAELLNNVAEHGRMEHQAVAPLVHLSVIAQEDGLSVAVSDDGNLLPRCCLAPTMPDPDAHPEGGFGWFLIANLTRSLSYFRENGRNFVSFTIPNYPDDVVMV